MISSVAGVMTVTMLLVGSLTSSPSEPPTAIEGACPVCLVEMGSMVAGKAEISSEYDGKTYRFPSIEQKKLFDANPTRYVPALGGDCVVCLVEMNQRIPGKLQYALVHRGRLYLFPGAEQQAKFRENPERYENADLALGGNCPVCKVEMGKDVPGNAMFAVDFRGRRYLFPDGKLRGMFLSNPAKYAVKD